MYVRYICSRVASSCDDYFQTGFTPCYVPFGSYRHYSRVKGTEQPQPKAGRQFDDHCPTQCCIVKDFSLDQGCMSILSCRILQRKAGRSLLYNYKYQNVHR